MEGVRWETESKKRISSIWRKHCFQGYSDFQKLISVHPDKIPAARGTTLDRDRLLEREGKIRSEIRRRTLMNTDRPQTARMWFARCFKWPEGLYYMVRGKTLRRSNKAMSLSLEEKHLKVPGLTWALALYRVHLWQWNHRTWFLKHNTQSFMDTSQIPTVSTHGPADIDTHCGQRTSLHPVQWFAGLVTQRRQWFGEMEVLLMKILEVWIQNS